MRVLRDGTACTLILLLSGCASWRTATPPEKVAEAELKGSPAPEQPAVETPPPSPSEEPRLQEPPVPPPSEPTTVPQPAPENQQTTPAPAAPPPPPPKLVSLNFEEADLLMVLRALADVAGINFILAQGVNVKVTMKVDGLPATEAFAIMEAILEANNLAAVKVGTIYKIVPVAAAPGQSAPIGVGKDLVAQEGYFTQIVPLQYLSAEGAIKIFQPLIAQGKVLAHPETNTMILSGPAPVIREIVKTLQALDIPDQQREVQRIYVYYVENAKANELAGVLTSVFGEKGEPPVPLRGPALARATPAAPPPPAPPRPGIPAAPAREALLPITPLTSEEVRLVGEVRIVPDERTNALLIKATPRDFQVIEETIQKLDITPKQVIIETLVAEITLTDSFNFGLEWFIRSGQFTFQQFFGLGPAAQALLEGVATNSAGFTLTFVDQDDVRVFLNTLASYTEIKTLASPHLLTQDNQEARIQVGQEVPIVTGTQSSVTAVAGGGESVFQTIQQRDVGRILTIRPHVNEKRQVTLSLNLEVSDTLPETTVAGTPSFSERTISTSVVVEDGQSLLIGGIIDKATQRQTSGIPLLRDIPILGGLFGNTADNVTKTELLIMLTPHVIATPEEGMAITEKFKQRMEQLKEHLQSVSPAAEKKRAPGSGWGEQDNNPTDAG